MRISIFIATIAATAFLAFLAVLAVHLVGFTASWFWPAEKTMIDSAAGAVSTFIILVTWLAIAITALDFLHMRYYGLSFFGIFREDSR